MNEIRKCRFAAAFTGELDVCQVVDDWNGLELFVLTEMEGTPDDEQSELLENINNPESWYGTPPFKFHQSIGETCSLTIFRVSNPGEA